METPLLAMVQKKLLGDDKCLYSVEATLQSEGGLSPRLIALVEGQGEHGMFVYTQNSEDLVLEAALPVNTDFKLNIMAPLSTSTADDGVPVRVSSGAMSLLLGLSGDDASTLFLAEVKRAIAGARLKPTVHSQQAGFGLPSTFSWMDKYSPTSTRNPFAEDIFDPVRDNPDANWPWQHVVQPNARKSCPVVTANDGETGMERTPSFHETFLDSWSSEHSLSGQEDKSIKRSFERSLDNLDEGGPGTKPQGGREEIIKLMMKNRAREYTNLETLSVFCGTWNVNGQPATEELYEWLAADDEPPDIYAIGFQELDLSKNAFIFTESVREKEWYEKVKKALHPEAKYKRLKLIRLVGMMLVVFVQTKHTARIFDVAWDTVGTGIMGMMGNKGGVGVRLDIYDSNMCFVNSHLAAHTEEYERRNQDYRDINSRMNFGNRNPPRQIIDHEIIFWIGDLNYRLMDIDNDKAKQYIEQGNFERLVEFDQLYRQQNLRRVFLDYQEGHINFIPTYKYDPGTDNWDTSEKCRTPAWCDRILYRGENVRQLVYRSHPTLRLSDHKPVSSVFHVGVKVVDTAQYRKVYEDTMKQLDKMENEFLPQVSLSSMELYFKDVKFIETQPKSITVANTGKVPVQFEFIKKLDDKSFCKPWLTVKPYKDVIDIGDEVEIVFEVYVQKDTAPKLNAGEDQIEDILVLHLDRGKDLFITVSGNYLPSCFGSSIEALVQMFGPIREVPVATLVDVEKRVSANKCASGERALDVPKELWRLMDHLNKYGISQGELFQQPGIHHEVQQIRDSLDTGRPAVLPGSIHSVAEALLLFLESMAEPVIPTKLCNKCLECCQNFILCKQVLSQMPVSHVNVFKYLMAFLRKLLKDSESVDHKSLATLFGELILRTRSRSQEASGPNSQKSRLAEDRKKAAAFVHHFLVNEYDE